LVESKRIEHKTVTKRTRVAILISDKIHFQTKIVGDRLFYNDQRVHQENVIIINMYSNNRTLRYIDEAKPGIIEGRNQQ